MRMEARDQEKSHLWWTWASKRDFWGEKDASGTDEPHVSSSFWQLCEFNADHSSLSPLLFCKIISLHPTKRKNSLYKFLKRLILFCFIIFLCADRWCTGTWTSPTGTVLYNVSQLVTSLSLLFFVFFVLWFKSTLLFVPNQSCLLIHVAERAITSWVSCCLLEIFIHLVVHLLVGWTSVALLLQWIFKLDKLLIEQLGGHSFSMEVTIKLLVAPFLVMLIVKNCIAIWWSCS